MIAEKELRGDHVGCSTDVERPLWGNPLPKALGRWQVEEASMNGRRTLKVAVGRQTASGNGPASHGRPKESLLRKARAAAAASVLGLGVLAASSVPVLASAATATPFKAQYSDGGSDYDCSGARIVNRVSVKDSETCLISGDTSWLYAGTFTGDPYGDVPGCTHCLFVSDYDGQLATSWSTTVVRNGDGTYSAYVVMYF